MWVSESTTVTAHSESERITARPRVSLNEKSMNTETKDITPFLKYYIGQQVKSEGTMIHTLTGLAYDCSGSLRPFFQDAHGNSIELFDFKLILSKLSSMREENWEEMFNIYGVSLGATNRDLWLDQFEKFGDRPKSGFGKKWKLQNPGIEPPTEKVKVSDGLKWAFYTYSPSALHYLLSKGFWLFGDEYFDAGLIIEKP